MGAGTDCSDDGEIQVDNILGYGSMSNRATGHGVTRADKGSTSTIEDIFRVERGVCAWR